MNTNTLIDNNSMRGKRKYIKLRSEILKRRDHLEDICVDGRMTKLTLEK